MKVLKTTKMRIVYYKRYVKPRHFCPAPGYNCPKIPLGGINAKGPDYEAVRVVRAVGCRLRGRRVLISWGLNIPRKKAGQMKQVIALPVENPEASVFEIVLAVD